MTQIAEAKTTSLATVPCKESDSEYEKATFTIPNQLNLSVSDTPCTRYEALYIYTLAINQSNIDHGVEAIHGDLDAIQVQDQVL